MALFWSVWILSFFLNHVFLYDPFFNLFITSDDICCVPPDCFSPIVYCYCCLHLYVWPLVSLQSNVTLQLRFVLLTYSCTLLMMNFFFLSHFNLVAIPIVLLWIRFRIIIRCLCCCCLVHTRFACNSRTIGVHEVFQIISANGVSFYVRRKCDKHSVLARLICLWPRH